MRFGVALPQAGPMTDPGATRDFAQAVEGLGYDHLIVFEHVLGADPADRPPGWRTTFNHKTFLHEPLVLFAHLGAVTTRLEFVSEIVILPQRQTVLFAKQAAETDYLTGGRLRLGVAIGWNALEYEGLNENFHNRGRRIEEQIEVLRLLWTQEVVDFKGRWHTIDRAGVNPLPVQRPIPLWFGGSSDAVLRRTARIADGWMPLADPSDAAFRETVARLRQYTREAGRDEAAVGIEGRINLGSSTPEDWLEELQAWRDLGAGHVGVGFGGPTSEAPIDYLGALERFLKVARQLDA